MPKQQLRWKVGTVYLIQGKAKGERNLRLVARTTIDGKETLLFQIQRRAKKQRK